MPPEILLVGPLYPPTQARLEELFTVHRLWEAREPEAFLREVGGRVRAIAVFTLHDCPSPLIAALPKLEIIACFGIGVDRIDLEAAKARGVRVTNTPDVVTEDTADMGLALILALARRIVEGDRFVRAGHWRQGQLPFGRRLAGSRLGILGLGRIGRAAARKAEAFMMEIGYSGPRPKPDEPYRYFADAVSLALWCDILFVSCPGGEATRHLVGRAVLDALGPEGILVNIARGSIIDEKALVEALLEGALGGAGLDVFENEPEVPEALFQMQNVVLMPHAGTATHGTRAAIGELLIANLLAHFAGRPLLTPVF